MIGTVTRLVADWLADPTYGVGAMLADVPRDAGDPLPTTPAVVDETRDDRLGRGRLPEAGQPYLAVLADQATAIDERVVTDDGYVSLAVRVVYVTQQLDASEAKRDGNTVLRAVAWSLRQLHRQDVSAAGRVRNQIALLRVGPITLEPWQEQLEQATILGALTVQLDARDSFAL